MTGPCAKTRVTCTLTFPDGRQVVGENACANPQPACPREPGEDYTKCRTVCQQLGHAEQQAVALCNGDARGASAVLRGHTYACQACQEALFGAGVVSLFVQPKGPAVTTPSSPGERQVLSDDEIRKGWESIDERGYNVGGGTTLTGWTNAVRWAERQIAARAALNEPSPPPPAPPAHGLPWRCFHCNEVFVDSEAALDHFGHSEHDKPGCQYDITHIRWMEAQHRRNVDDDSEALRTVRSLAGEHEALRRKAEELGYARGLADARRHPEELGLVAAPPAPGVREALAPMRHADFVAHRAAVAATPTRPEQTAGEVEKLREALTGLLEVINARNDQGGRLRLNEAGRARVDAALAALSATQPKEPGQPEQKP
jgi:hypothetical protein